MARSSKQAGSVMTNFIITAVILVICIAGVIYALNRRNAQVAQQPAITVNEEPPTETDKEKDTTDSSPIETEEDSQPVQTTPVTATVPEVTDLPATGGELGWVEVSVIYLVTFAGASYILSRRQLAAKL